MILNIVQSQLAWFACVLGAAWNYPWWGAVIALLLTAIHIFRTKQPQHELLLAGAAGLIGLTADSVLSYSGLLIFQHGMIGYGLAPVWMVALWINFATMLNGALRWLQNKLLLAALIGAVAGPLAYFAGSRLGALQITDPKTGLLAVALVWALALPFLCALAQRQNRKLPGVAVCLSLALALGVSEPLTAQSSVDTEKNWSFRVRVDDREIGQHDFTLKIKNEQRELITRARFQVKAFLINFYTYEHDNRELWRENCLTSIEARTNDNGDKTTVRGARTAANLTLTVNGENRTLANCVMSFAYWNPDMLQAKRLLNSQTGEYEAVNITARGKETIKVRGIEVVAERHTLRTKDYTIDLWYSEQGEWLKLNSTTPQGKLLQYELI
jgi:hypothetical protein